MSLSSFSSLAAVPWADSRYGVSCSIGSDNNIYMYGGGTTSPTFDNSVYKYSISGNSFSLTTNTLPAAKGAVQWTTSSGVIIMGCGQTSASSWSSTIYYASLPYTSWSTSIANAPFGGRAFAGSVQTSHGLFVIGGEIGTSSSAADVWVSTDGLGAVWNQMCTSATCNFGQREQMAAAVLQNSIVICAGLRWNTATYLNDCYANMAGDGVSWVSKSNAPFSPRLGADMVGYGGVLYLAGGYTGSTLTNDVWSNNNYGASSSWSMISSAASFVKTNNNCFIVYANKLYLTANTLQSVFVATLPSIQGDPTFIGFDGRKFQVHGISNTYYNLLSTPLMRLNALFSFLSAAAPLSFPKNVPSKYSRTIKTAYFAHPGNYLSEIGIVFGFHSESDNDDNNNMFHLNRTSASQFHSLELIAGAKDEGFNEILINGQPFSLPDEVASFPLVLKLRKSSLQVLLRFTSPFELFLQCTGSFAVRASPSRKSLGPWIAGARGRGFVSVTQSLSLQIVNADGFFNVRDIYLHKGCDHFVSYTIDGLIGQSCNRFNQSAKSEVPQIQDFAVDHLLDTGRLGLFE